MDAGQVKTMVTHCDMICQVDLRGQSWDDPCLRADPVRQCLTLGYLRSTSVVGTALRRLAPRYWKDTQSLICQLGSSKLCTHNSSPTTELTHHFYPI